MNYEAIEKECWYPDFVNPEQYIKLKLKMLRRDMCIQPTKKEIAHLHTLRDRNAIDRAVHSIIDRHWDEE